MKNCDWSLTGDCIHNEGAWLVIGQIIAVCSTETSLREAQRWLPETAL